MRITKVAGELAGPDAPGWRTVETANVQLDPVPIEAQPTEYIRTAWADRPYGNVDVVNIAAARDGDNLYVRLDWADSEIPNTEFPDAACVFFPASNAATVETFGDDDSPVSIWHWQSNADCATALVGRGPGVFRPAPAPAANGDLRAAAQLAAGRWAIVLSGSVDSVNDRLGVAVWDGSNEERAGIGAVTPAWIPIEIEF